MYYVMTDKGYKPVVQPMIVRPEPPVTPEEEKARDRREADFNKLVAAGRKTAKQYGRIFGDIKTD